MKNIKIKSGSLISKIAFTALLLFLFVPVSAQDDQENVTREATKFLQQAEEALAENNFPAAEAHYRKAIAKDPQNAAARFNLGNLYYNKEIAGQAVERHTQAAAVAGDKSIKHNSFHNKGNTFMKQKKYKEAVEAYKNSLRNDPSDDETRYNLALAKKLLEEQKKKGGGDNKNQDQNQDQKKDQQKENKDQQGDKGENKEDKEGDPKEQKEGGEEENKDKKEGEDKKGDEGKPQDEKKKQGEGEKEEQQQKQPVPGQLSPQQVKNLLEAMGNEEKKIQDRINERKAQGAKVQTAKDW